MELRGIAAAKYGHDGLKEARQSGYKSARYKRVFVKQVEGCRGAIIAGPEATF